MAADQLVKCLRFNFLDMHNMMSAIRKNVAIHKSQVMTDSFNKEVKERQKLKKPGIARILSQVQSLSETATPEEELHFCGRARKYFNLQKLESQGR